MKKSILILALVFSGIQMSFAQTASTYSFSETFDVETPTHLSVISRYSDIEVVSHDAPTIEVQILATQNGELLDVNRKQLDKMIKRFARLEMTEVDGGLKMEVRSLTKNGYIDMDKDVVINFRVLVPSDTKCQLISSAGDITLAGLTPDQKCITSEGDVKVNDVEGNVIAKTQHGDIYLDNINGRIASDSGNGEVFTDSRTAR